jgi:hypothetical protein
MRESYREGIANHPGPEPCEGGRKAALEALDRGICRLGIEPSRPGSGRRGSPLDPLLVTKSISSKWEGRPGGRPRSWVRSTIFAGRPLMEKRVALEVMHKLSVCSAE